MLREILERAPYLADRETESFKTKPISIAGVEFEITTTSQEQENYISRITGPYINNQQTAISERVQLVALKGSPAIIPPEVLAERKILSSQQTYEYGLLAENVYYTISRLGFANITFEGESTSHVCIGIHPEFGLASFLKANLLRHYWLQHQPLSIFHAASMVHKPTNSTVVISGAELFCERGNRCGKTTTLLASSFRHDAPFAFSSNDEVIIQNGEQEPQLLPFPNQIPIRQGTLEAIRRERLFLSVDPWMERDDSSGEFIYNTTPGALACSGVDVVGLAPEISNWIFVNVRFGRDSNSIEEVNETVARDLLTSSLFRRRIGQAQGNLHLAELETSYNINSSDVQKAQDVFDRLQKRGVKFWVLTGGTERNSLFQTVNGVFDKKI